MLAQGDTITRTRSPKVTLDSSLWRNTFPPSPCGLVYLQLPVELLQKIFLLLVNLYPGHLSSRPDWITITYVCRYWRSAALDLRELWTHITPRLSISWSEAMMDRSAPLSVHIDRLIDVWEGVEALAAPRLLSAARIRSLRLLGSPAGILKVLNRLCSPSPLESLSLCVSDMVEPMDLPETLCERNMPHFRRLTFEAIGYIRAPLWLLASVTHLTTGASVSLRELLGTLQAIPQLEVLCCAYVFDEGDHTHVPEQLSLARAILPRLSLLSVDTFPHCLLILSPRIDAPPTLRRHIFWRLYIIYEWEPDIFMAMQAFVPHDSAPGMDDGGLRVAQVTGGPTRGWFEAWSRAGDENTGADAGAFAREDALFLFHLDWQCVRITAPNAVGPLAEHRPFFHLASLCAHLHTTRIEDLTVTHEALNAVKGGTTDVQDISDLTVGMQWQALLAALPSVKTLRLHRGSPACVSVLRALAASRDLLPHLQKVFVVKSTVRYAADSAAWAGGVGVADADSMASCTLVQGNVGADLVEAVSVRSEVEVVLVGCEVDEEALEALRKWARVDFVSEWEYMQSVNVTLE